MSAAASAQAVALALLSALGFAGAQVAAKRGLRSVSIEAGLVLSLACACVVIAVATAVRGFGSMAIGSAAIFALSGLITPGISRWASITAVDRLGPSVSAPLQQSARPLLSVFGAVVVLGESVGVFRAIGVAGVIVGGWQLATVRPEAFSEGISGKRPLRRRLTWRRAAHPGLLFPFIAAASYATSDIVVKREFGTTPEPFVAAAIGIGSAFIAWSAAAWIVPSVRKRLVFGPDVRWFALSGCVAGIAILAQFGALEKGDVSLVVPLIAAQPLMVFVLSHFFLRGIERIERSTVMGGFLIVAGTILVSM